MKKIFLTLIFLFIVLSNISAETIEVTFSDCVDGDTAKFIYNGEKITVRFLAIETPETVSTREKVETWGKEASEYTCNELKKAEEIKLEYDTKAKETDLYGRHLVWVFVDGQLLQKKLVDKGYAKIDYIYRNYKYVEELKKAEQVAKDNKLGIWSITTNNEQNEINLDSKTDINSENENISETDYKEIIILIGIIVIMCIFSTKARKKVKKEVNKEISRQIKKRFKK